MNANQPKKLIIGLGNPGKEYLHTYHNIGEWSLSYLKKWAAEAGFLRVSCLQPEGYMNESGISVRKILKNSNLSQEQIIIVHDDSDLPLGTYKISRGGGSAGHRGIQSIIDNLGSEDFLRLRIGIRKAEETVRRKAADFVLERFSDEQEKIFEEALKKAWTEITELLQK